VGFIETKQYQRFKEFCDACRKYKYIGLCYGPPGVGKTLSARHYTRWDKIESYKQYMSSCGVNLCDVIGSSSILYTAKVISTPHRLEEEIRGLRKILRDYLIEDQHRQQEEQSDEVRRREKEEEMALHASGTWTNRRSQEIENHAYESLRQINIEFLHKRDEVQDPTTLVMIDEADRLRMSGLEQVRDIFDRGDIGMVLIGMPGIEKRLARYPQLYSRVGFVHEFKPLSQADVRQLLRDGWAPSGVTLPDENVIEEDALATLIRIAEGRFRLLHRLLTQIARVLEINRLDKITTEVVEAARESLVIGTA
jgi:DNA transposition AAA+ family ATPase